MNDNDNNNNQKTYTHILMRVLDPMSVFTTVQWLKACTPYGSNMKQIETEIKPFSMSFTLCNSFFLSLLFRLFVCLFVHSFSFCASRKVRMCVFVSPLYINKRIYV